MGGEAGSTQTAEEGGGELVEGEGSGLGYGQWAPDFWLGVEGGWRGTGIEQGSGGWGWRNCLGAWRD